MPEDFPLADVIIVDKHGVVDLVVPTSDPALIVVYPVLVCLN